jgi:hypothetical protein
MKALSQPSCRVFNAEERLVNSRQLAFIEWQAEALCSYADIFERR